MFGLNEFAYYMMEVRKEPQCEWSMALFGPVPTHPSGYVIRCVHVDYIQSLIEDECKQYEESFSEVK